MSNIKNTEKMIILTGNEININNYNVTDATLLIFDCVVCGKKERVLWKSFKCNKKLECSLCKRKSTNIIKYGAKTWSESMKLL